MRWALITGLGLGGLAIAAFSCSDSSYETSTGAPAPRLSASLNESTPGSLTYDVRVLVLPEAPAASKPSAPRDSGTTPVSTSPPKEFLSVVATGGAKISFNGSPLAPTFCAPAGSELLFQVTSVLGSSEVVITLGTYSGDGGSPLVGPSSNCGAPNLFDPEETIAVTIPSSPATPSPAGVDAATAPKTKSDASSSSVDASSDRTSSASDAGGDR